MGISCKSKCNIWVGLVAETSVCSAQWEVGVPVYCTVTWNDRWRSRSLFSNLQPTRSVSEIIHDICFKCRGPWHRNMFEGMDCMNDCSAQICRLYMLLYTLQFSKTAAVTISTNARVPLIGSGLCLPSVLTARTTIGCRPFCLGPNALPVNDLYTISYTVT